MTIRSFTTLVSACTDVMEDDSTEFAAYVPTAIRLAENRLHREVDGYDVLSRTTISFLANQNTVAKPNKYRYGFDLMYRNAQGESRVLVKTTDSFIHDYWPWATTSVRATVEYYADRNSTHFLIAPTPAFNYEAYVTFSRPPVYLSAGNQTNYFTDKIPDALYFATLVEMAAFSRNTAWQQLWEARYQNAVVGLKVENKRARRDEATFPPNSPRPIRNTLDGEN